MVKSMYILVLIQHHVKSQTPIKKLLIPKCQPLLLEENYTERKRDGSVGFEGISTF